MALNLVHSPEGTCGQKHFDGALATYHFVVPLGAALRCAIVFYKGSGCSQNIME
jgi:hypothetical protein